MSNDTPDINERVAQIERTMERDRILQHDHISRFESRIEELQERVLELESANKPAPFHRKIPAAMCERIVKLRADLFHNPDAKQGGCKYVLKLFVWLDRPQGSRGHIVPLEFWLNTDTPIVGVKGGYLTHKPSKTRPDIKGTIVERDHIAMCAISEFDSHLPMIRIGGSDWTLEEYEAIADRKPKSPIARWYWNKPKP